ncbi:hypothetical protein J5A73_09215 [Leptotrichia sp. oral taxon 218]|uniref:hypothetical protein n=1 Tax=Leptotrichia sp. oral taxon 218 TaxID=712361 RepID=UPI001B8C4503|nr:hypothetical protein [Leptotrichia sp. oral taxon 218]QUB95143.1 hypothetical protein J5A73_09215 [Leptotrichia sp. oral taxon 218]
MKLDLEEKDFLQEIINFKIINRKDIEERYGFNHLKYMILKFNKIFRIFDEEGIHDNSNYIYYFGNYTTKIFKLESQDKKLKMTYRRELIELFLLFSEKKLSIYRILKKMHLNEDEKNKIKRDVYKVLFKYKIKYSEYKDFEDIKELFQTKGYKINKVREQFLVEILSKRLEREKNDIYSENFYLENLELTLNTKNITYIKKILFSYLDEKTVINSIKEKYQILTKFLMNLKNQKSKIKKENFVKNQIQKEYFKMVEKILKKEEIEFYPKIIKDIYKKVEKNLKEEKEKDEVESINNKINEHLTQENSIEDKIELYKIEEKRRKHNNQEFIDKRIKKIYVFPSEIKRTKTLILMDVEENNISRIFSEIQKMAGFLEIVKVSKLSEFKKSINKTEKRYEQIVIVSTSNRINDMKNFSKIPVYLLSVGNLKSSMTSVKRKDYLIGKILILEDLIKEYQALISEREASIRLIKRNKRRKEKELQKKKKLLEIKSKIERMRKQKK